MKSHLVVCAMAQFVLLLNEAVAFQTTGNAAATINGQSSSSLPTTGLKMVSRDELMRPHFHAPSSSMATTRRRTETDMGQIIVCADGSSNCSIEEMISMVEGMMLCMFEKVFSF